MNLIETLKYWDTSLFFFLNGLHTSYFDGFMFAVSGKLIWIPLYVVILYTVIKNKKYDALWVVLALVLCVVIADQIASGILKGWVQRLRPSRNDEFEGMVHLVNDYRSGLYGFVSSHAANSVGLAVLTSLLFRHRVYVFSITVWALLVSYSRIYLGVHYPLDILGGALVGAFVAWFCYFILKKFRPSASAMPNTVNKELKIILSILSLTFLGIIIYSFFNSLIS